ncbi:type I-E CRISPR-associated protein Cas6/Cse3/CasE [Streptomyces sp. NPDC006733]|uniref:type I-E CRISPR-associated protein Cas6/Cse3/CasE n=1 Tax=Streptomyces sp. NPDC006733 TaxID=3155460 RepID=UPI0033FC6C92
MTTAPAAPATVHLAQLRLQTTRRHTAVYADLTDATKLHHRIQSLFPDALGPAPRAATNTLYRLERDRDGATLLIQSTLPINRNALPDGYTDGDIHYRDLTPLLAWITTGRVVRYRIDANPIKSIHVPGQRGTRVPLAGEDAVAWWHTRAATAGLDIASALDIPQPPIDGDRGQDGHGKPNKRLRLRAIRFEGVATVTDPDALRTAITTGIGQGRAYGLGLLSIAPHRP